MKHIKDIFVKKDTILQEIIEVIQRGNIQLALVVDDDQKLKGSITDGDIRRAILKYKSFEVPASKIMNKNPVVAPLSLDKDALKQMLIQHGLNQVPTVNEDGTIIGVVTLESVIDIRSRTNVAFIMAGGLGQRLRPLTEEIPKPMLKIGNKPILGIIITYLIEHGFKTFYISVNHKAELIKEYFKDGSHLNIDIHYLHEDTKLGTAGSLSLIEDIPKEPMLVMNADILTKVNLDNLFDYHAENNSDITLCVKKHSYMIPYGVVTIDGHKIVSIDEKPTHDCFVAAGIYIINPSIFKFLEKDKHIDMPDLIKRCFENKKLVSSFPIHEYWLDIGQMADYQRAIIEHDQL